MKGLIVRWTVLVALGAGDALLPSPWRLFAVGATVLYLIEWTALRHRVTTIRIVRLRRHRLANQLQLVGGWLQLGAVGKAEEALETLMKAEMQQSQWFRRMPSHWSYLFLRWDAASEERGVTIHWEGLDSLLPTYRMAWMLERRMAQAMRIAETAIWVQFRSQGFSIRVNEQRHPLPREWIVVDEGMQTDWPRGRTPASGGTANRM